VATPYLSSPSGLGDFHHTGGEGGKARIKGFANLTVREGSMRGLVDASTVALSVERLGGIVAAILFVLVLTCVALEPVFALFKVYVLTRSSEVTAEADTLWNRHGLSAADVAFSYADRASRVDCDWTKQFFWRRVERELRSRIDAPGS
jgi:hypothetical protein